MGAAEALLEAPGFVVAQRVLFDSQLAESVWVTARQGGDFVSFTARDLSVLGSATAATSGVEITARAYVDDSLYQASIAPDDEAPWFEVEEAQIPDDPHIPIGIRVHFPEGLYPAAPEDLGEEQEAAATRQSLSNGGTQLVVTQSSETTLITERWEIHPDGHLAAYSIETNQSGSPEFPVPSMARLEFSLLTEPAPISPPTVGSPLDITRYDIPDDLDLLR